MHRGTASFWLVICVVLFTRGVGAQDRDRDGRLDDLDLCPEVSEGRARLFPGDGCPDVDVDGDRIVDDYDFCPTQRETVNEFRDADGCPDIDSALLHELGERVLFATGSHALDETALTNVRRIAAFLVAHAEVRTVDIIGHADARGTPTSNEELSYLRARAVRYALVDAGVAPDRLMARGLGALAGDSEEAQAQNRRCELRATLERDPRVEADTSALAGLYRGDAYMDVEVGPGLTSAAIALHPAGAGATFLPYAARVVGDRLVLVFAAPDGDRTLVMRQLPGARAVGFVETRGPRVTRIPWTAAMTTRFDQAAVAAMIRDRIGLVQACYESALRTQHDLRGRVEITLTVLSSGDTARVRVSRDGLGPVPAPSVGACLVGVFDAFHFDPGPLGFSVSFTFPFVFEPQP